MFSHNCFDVCTIVTNDECDNVTNGFEMIIWNNVFKNGPTKISGRQLSKNLKGYALLKQIISLQMF